MKLHRKSSYKEPTVNRCLLPFRSWERKFQRNVFYRQIVLESSCAREKTVDKDIVLTSRNGERKIMQSARITSRPPVRKRKWSQLSHFCRISTKVIPIEKTKASHISTMIEGFKRSNK